MGVLVAIHDAQVEREESMDEQSVLELMKRWGYFPLPKPHPDSPGYSGLLVAIREQPTGKHFDPQTLHLRLRDEKGLARWRTLSWLSPLEAGTDHACAGLVTLYDRSGKRVDFFTFGGTLEVTSVPGEVVYALRSPAPVLELTAHDETAPDQLASETELLMGEMEERWGLDEQGYDRRLAAVEPLQFYLAVLQSILLHYERARVLEKAYHQLYDVLRQEKEWLVEKRIWPVKSLVLEDLLAPD
jgi:hypothetical protein